MEERQAIILLKSGDLLGLEILVRQYYFRAVRASYLIVQDRSQAEDIVQTAFLHAGDKIDQLAAERFGPWFLRSVVNASIKAAERQKRQISLDAEEEAGSQTLVEWLIDQRPSIEERIETEELRQEVWKALGELTASQRAAIVSRYYLGMSEAEMTRELNVPLSTIKWRLFAAREKLRSLLKPLRSSPAPSEPKTTRRYPKRQE